jgi:lia operon protein LiaF
MRKKTQIIVGAVIVAWGLLLLVGNLLGINIWNYVWPLFLIGLGIWLLTRSQREGRFTHVVLLGDQRRRGAWQVRDENLFSLIGDVSLDLTEAEVPVGESTLRVQGFVNSVVIRVPDDIGLAITSTAFVTSATVFGHKHDYIMTPYEMESDNYHEVDRRVRLELLYFVADLKVRRADTKLEG